MIENKDQTSSVGNINVHHDMNDLYNLANMFADSPPRSIYG